MATEYVNLKITKRELIMLCSLVDSFSSIADGIEDDGSAKREVKSFDKMIKRNGYKRIYS